MAEPAHAGRSVIVTGASRGIGRAIALEYARQGANVMLTARDVHRLRDAADEIRQLGGRAEFIALDLRERAAAAALVEATLFAYEAIDVVVNNAGATKRGAFLDLTDDDWLDGFALKLHGAVRLTRTAWPHLKARRGSVVMIAGVGGRTPGAEFTIGGSVNAAITTFTKALADVGVGDGIQVNAVNPGYIRTDRFATRMQRRAAATQRTATEAEAEIIAAERLVRIGEPADVANLVTFLTSPRGRYLHGAIIDLDGGQTKTV